MEKIVIFGASGFLGGHLLKHLEGNISAISLRNPNWLDTFPSDPDVIINCIGKAHDHDGKATEMDFFEANYGIVKQIFAIFLKSSASLFVHVSSLAAVEESERSEIVTETSENKPVSSYGKSKREAEIWLLGQVIPADKKLLVLRPSMIHGEGDKGNLKLLYKIIAKGIPYPLGAFNNSRTFVSVDNVVFLINEIVRRKENIESGIYNIADDESVSTKRIIEIIGDIRGSNPYVLSIPKYIIFFLAKIGDKFSLPFTSKRLEKMTSNLIVSNEKIKTTLNINKLPLSAEEGLAKTIDSFRS